MKVLMGAKLGQKLCEHFKIDSSLCKKVTIVSEGRDVATFNFELMCPDSETDQIIKILTDKDEN